MTLKTCTSKPATTWDDVVFLHCAVRYRTARHAALFGLAEIAGRMKRLHPLGASASDGFRVEDCVTRRSCVVTFTAGRASCDCGCDSCVVAEAIEQLLAEGSL